LIRALNEFGVHQAQLKWPNDILLNTQKLAGILIELQGDLDGPSTAVIGIGINLNLPKSLIESIDQPTTDLHKTLNAPINQNILLGNVLKHLAQVLGNFEQMGFVALKEEWTAYHAYHQQTVRLLMPNGTEVLGVVKDVADDGILMVETALGLQRFSAGEISLRHSESKGYA
jgi:BirA family biotin operon repressor/biotin-[acetyl-CoA-carboxylase] ligase